LAERECRPLPPQATISTIFLDDAALSVDCAAITTHVRFLVEAAIATKQEAPKFD
jgi:hypothetical protein